MHRERERERDTCIHTDKHTSMYTTDIYMCVHTYIYIYIYIYVITIDTSVLLPARLPYTVHGCITTPQHKTYMTSLQASLVRRTTLNIQTQERTKTNKNTRHT